MADTPSVSNGFRMNFDFDSGATHAKLINASDGTTIAVSNADGILVVSEDKVNSGYNQYSFQVLDAQDNQINYDSIVLYFINGSEEVPDLSGTPFEIRDGSNGDASPFELIDNHYLEVDSAIGSVGFQFVNPVDGSYSVKITDENNDSCYPLSEDGCGPLTLDYGYNFIKVYIEDQSGLYHRTYPVTVYRADNPEGVSDWSYAYGEIVSAKWIRLEDSIISNGPKRYVAYVPENVDQVSLNVTLLDSDANGYLYQGAGGSGAEMAQFGHDSTSFNIDSLAPGYNRFQLYVPAETYSESEFTDLVIIRGAIPETYEIPTLNSNNLMWGDERPVIPTEDQSFAIFADETDSVALSFEDVYYGDLLVDGLGEPFLHYDGDGIYTISSGGEAVRTVFLKYFDPILNDYQNHVLHVYFDNIPDSLKLSNVSVTDVTYGSDTFDSTYSLNPSSADNPVGYGGETIGYQSMKVKLNVITLDGQTSIVGVYSNNVEAIQEEGNWFLNLPDTGTPHIAHVRFVVEDSELNRMSYDVFFTRPAGETQ